MTTEQRTHSLSEHQIKQAIEMHDANVSWMLIAIYFKTNTTKLRKQIKDYENNSKQVLCAASDSGGDN